MQNYLYHGLSDNSPLRNGAVSSSTPSVLHRMQLFTDSEQADTGWCHFSHVPRQPQCSGILLCFCRIWTSISASCWGQCLSNCWMCSFVAVDLVAYAKQFFTVWRYAHVVLAMGLCLSQVGVLLKCLNVGSQKQDHTWLTVWRSG